MKRGYRANIVIPGNVSVGDMLQAIENIREYGSANVSVGSATVVVIAEWTEEDDWDLLSTLRDTAGSLRALGLGFEIDKAKVYHVNVDPSDAPTAGVA